MRWRSCAPDSCRHRLERQKSCLGGQTATPSEAQTKPAQASSSQVVTAESSEEEKDAAQETEVGTAGESTTAAGTGTAGESTTAAETGKAGETTTASETETGSNGAAAETTAVSETEAASKPVTGEAGKGVDEENTGAETTMRLLIGEEEIPVAWEENESVKALQKLSPLTIQMSMYGGFEQVGPIGQNIVREDQQTVTDSGDIVLYSGNQIVIFYGSNSWAYTRLGHIDLSEQEMRNLLSNGDVTITLE